MYAGHFWFVFAGGGRAYSVSGAASRKRVLPASAPAGQGARGLCRSAKGRAAAAQARDTLIRHNLRLVAHICKKYYAGNSAQDDMISIGTIGLIKAVDTFDPAKGKRFASYASRCIENAILTPTRFARKIGTSDTCVRSWENNTKLISRKSWERCFKGRIK